MEPVRSIYESDPDMREIVRLFAEELPQRAAELEDFVASGDLDRLYVLAHQLKGAGAGYGYAQVTEFASMLESAVASRLDEEEVEERAYALCALLRAVVPPAESQ